MHLSLPDQIRAAGLPEPTLEHVFCPPRKWRFDYSWIAQKVAAECEGGHWVGGRHNRGTGFVKDMTKYNEAALAGWLLVRFTPAMVKDGSALALLVRALSARQ